MPFALRRHFKEKGHIFNKIGSGSVLAPFSSQCSFVSRIRKQNRNNTVAVPSVKKKPTRTSLRYLLFKDLSLWLHLIDKSTLF